MCSNKSCCIEFRAPTLNAFLQRDDMIELKRLTTQYDPAEDRIRLTGTNDQGQTMCLWLIQRLLNRLVFKGAVEAEQAVVDLPNPVLRLFFDHHSSRIWFIDTYRSPRLC
jgi:hypothetical protein